MAQVKFLKSTASKGIVVYALVAVLLTVVFSAMVFENQLELITENAFLRSVQAGLELRERVETLARRSPEWTEEIGSVMTTARDATSFTVFTGSGEILASAGRETSVATDGELLMIHRAITQRDFESRLITHVLDRRQRQVQLFVPFEYPQAQIGVLGVNLRMTSIQEWSKTLNRQALIVGVIVLVIHSALALYAHRLFVLPLKQLVGATNSIAGGRYEVDLPERRDDEFGELARSFRRMSHAVRQMHDEARSSNPLSGLPGNVEIERHIRRRMTDDRPFCVLYCDLDDFKAYNDTYGFAQGDAVILFLKSCLVDAASQSATLPVFVGHEGGDDFVAVTDYSDWERVAQTVIELFNAGIAQFLPDEDFANGFIMAEDRRGNMIKHNLTSVSIAAVTNYHRDFANFGEIVRVATDMKRLVKSRPGSGYAIERRSG